jgi:predicted nucleic acid-binding protein
MNAFVVDTGVLLIHAANFFENGRLLDKATTFLKIPKPDSKGLATAVDHLFSSVDEILVTPYVLSEFCSLAQSRLRLRESKLEEFLNHYNEILLKMRECQCSKEELMAFKQFLKLCFTDSSVALASKREGAPLFTIDSRLVGCCRSQKIDAKHLYYDYYLDPRAQR